MRKLNCLLFLLLFLLGKSVVNAQALIRADHLTGRDDETGLNIVPDNMGGYYSSIYFSDSIAPDPMNPQNFLAATGSSGMVIIHIDAAGNLLWMLPFADGGTGIGEMIADASGNLYFIGNSNGALVMDSTYGFQFMNVGNYYSDIFLAKFYYNGSFAWIDQFYCQNSQPRQSRGSQIALHNNEIIISGTYQQTVDFDPGAGSFVLTGSTSINSSSIYIGKYDQVTGGMINVVSLQGSGNSHTINGIECTSSGKVFIGGTVASQIDFDPLAPGVTFGNGQSDIYMAGYTSSLNLIWAQALPDGTSQEVEDFTIANNQLILCGTYAGTVDFDPSAATSTLNSGDAYVGMYDTLGNLTWISGIRQASTLGASHPLSIDIIGNNAFVGGSYTGTIDIDPTSGVRNLVGSTNYIKGFLICYQLTNGFLVDGWDITGGGMFRTQVRDVAHANSTTLLVNYTFDAVMDADITSGVSNIFATLPSSSTARDACVGVYALLDLAINSPVAIVEPQLFPVPCDQQLKIKGAASFSSYAMFDATGRIVRDGKISPMVDPEIPVGDLPNGVYFIAFHSDRSIVRKSFIITHSTP